MSRQATSALPSLHSALTSEVQSPEEESLGIQIVGTALLLAVLFVVFWLVFGADDAAKLTGIAVVVGSGLRLGAAPRQVTALTAGAVTALVVGATALWIVWGYTVAAPAIVAALAVGVFERRRKRAKGEPERVGGA